MLKKTPARSEAAAPPLAIGTVMGVGQDNLTGSATGLALYFLQPPLLEAAALPLAIGTVMAVGQDKLTGSATGLAQHFVYDFV